MRDSKKNQRKQAYTGGYLKQKKHSRVSCRLRLSLFWDTHVRLNPLQPLHIQDIQTPAYIRMHNGSLYTFVKKVPNPYKYF